MQKQYAKPWKIAIIGSGIAGLTAAYKFNAQHVISVFEAAERIDGHAATMDVHLDGQRYAVDTGFIVYCTNSLCALCCRFCINMA